MKAQWDQKVMRLTRRVTQKPDAEGVATLLAALSRRCDRNFRFVFPGNRRECFLAYKEPSGNGSFQREIIALADAANLHLEADGFDLPTTPETTAVRQLAEPSLDTDVPATIQALAGATRAVLDSRGGQVLRVLVEWNDELTQIAAGFRGSRMVKDGYRIFVPGLYPRRMIESGIPFSAFALGFYLDQFEPEISPVSVQMGESETGSPVFVDAGWGHVLILGPANSRVGRSIGNQLALKAVQAGQIVVVVQPQVENLGVLAQANPKIISTRMDERTIAIWQSQVLVGPSLSVVQGHPGGNALEKLKTILEGLWTAAQMESRRDDWPGATVLFNDFIPTASEPGPNSTDRRTLPPYRHQLYELLAQMAGSFNAIRLILLGRPVVVYDRVEHLQTVVGSFGSIVRLRTVAEGLARGEVYSHDRDTDQEYKEWLHAKGTHGRCLVLGPEGWVKTKLDVVEPEIEVAAEPEIRVLRPDEVSQPHRWEPRERRGPTAPTVPPWAPTEPTPTAGELERLLKATGVLPLAPKEKEVLKALKAEEEAKAEAAEGKAEEESKSICKTVLSKNYRKILRKILDIVDALGEKGLEPKVLVSLIRKGVTEEIFKAFLDGELSREELMEPHSKAAAETRKRLRDLQERTEDGLADVLPTGNLATLPA